MAVSLGLQIAGAPPQMPQTDAGLRLLGPAAMNPASGAGPVTLERLARSTIDGFRPPTSDLRAPEETTEHAQGVLAGLAPAGIGDTRPDRAPGVTMRLPAP